MKFLGIVFVGSKWTIQNTYLIDNLVTKILVISANIDLRVWSFELKERSIKTRAILKGIHSLAD